MDGMFKNGNSRSAAEPAANDTWELQGSLLGTQETSETIAMDFPGPCKLVGNYRQSRGYRQLAA